MTSRANKVGDSQGISIKIIRDILGPYGCDNHCSLHLQVCCWRWCCARVHFSLPSSLSSSASSFVASVTGNELIQVCTGIGDNTGVSGFGAALQIQDRSPQSRVESYSPRQNQY